MKRAVLTVAAAALLSSTMTTPANAAVTILDTVAPAGPNSTTLAAMQTQCTALAAAHGTAWHGVVDETSIVATWVSGPTEIGTEADRNIDYSTRVGVGTFTPAHTQILGDPFRNGGSVNMFGIEEAVGGHYSNSAYDFTADFTSTYSYAFNCTMTETVHVPVQGYYTVDPNAPGDSKDAIRANCDAYNAMGPDASQPWWGTDHAFCDFTVTTPAHDEDQPRPDEAGTPINQDQVDTLHAHESFGSGFDTSDTLIIGQVVVCISSSKTGTKLPGAWTAQNGYDGSKCNSTWYYGGATAGVPNLNDGSHNWVTVPVI
jgi:hypothetical protein